MQFRLLGALEITAGARRLTLTRRRERWLLAVLLLEVGRAVSTEQLVDLLWDDPPPAARRALHSHVARIRALLASAAATGTALESRHGGYALTTDPEHVDAHRFRSLVRRARAADDPAQRWTLLCQALNEWRGPVLDGDGAESLRMRLCADLEELRLAAVESWATAGLALGRHAELIPELTRQTAQLPTRERLAELRMRALYASGRQADALAVYRQIRSRLTGELGLEPGPTLRRLHDAILREEAVEPPEAAQHRRPASRRGRPAVPAVPAQLPAAPSAFTGRLGAIRELDELLHERSAAPVAVITGTAGVGKTGLALHWAHRTAGQFRDGQLFVNLRAYAADAPVQPMEALRRFLRALDVDAPQIPDDVDEAAALYRSHVAGRRMLVVLDNAASADQVRPLLPGTATCTTLVTGRDRLHGLVANDGARLIDLDVLTADEACALVESLLGPDTVAAQSDAVAELVERCARLPLALRLAAANLISRAHARVAEYVSELANGNPLTALDLAGNEQAAVATAFDLSYVALPPAAKRLFRLVSLVPGHDFGVPTAAALAAVPIADARRNLNRLCDAHLVAECRPGRYHMHDLLCSYATAQLVASEPEADRTTARRRLVDFYLRTTHEAYPLLLPRRDDWPCDLVHPPVEPLRFADRAAALEWHEQERENMVGVVRQAADQSWHGSTWQLARSLHAFFSVRRHWSDWLTVARIGLASARRLGDVRAAIGLHNSLGTAHRQLRRYTEARRQFTIVLRLATMTGYGRMVGAANLALGGLCVMVGNAASGESYIRAALAVPGYGDNPVFAAICHQNLGCALLEMDRNVEAAEALERAMELSSAMGEQRIASHVHHNLAELALRRHDLATARHHAERQLDLNSEIGDPLRQATALDMLATCLARTDRVAARAHWESARAICHELGHPLGDVLSDWLDTFDRTTGPVTVATLDQAMRSRARRCM